LFASFVEELVGGNEEREGPTSREAREGVINLVFAAGFLNNKLAAKSGGCRRHFPHLGFGIRSTMSALTSAVGSYNGRQMLIWSLSAYDPNRTY
jgi:hypothetical protein